MALKFTIGQVPRTRAFQFADLMELTVLVGLSTQVSRADLDALINTGNIDADPDDDHEANTDSDAIAVTASKVKNAEDCFGQFEYRAGALDEHYPFQVEQSLLTPRKQITNSGYVYLFCLVCSRLGSFSGKKGFTQRCAKLFTELAAVALSASLKKSADVYVFDANSADRKAHFHTDLRKALRKLAVELNARPDEHLIDQQSSAGDGGLDLVAFNRMGDKALGVMAYFGQCAAQQNGWPSKTLEPKKTAGFFAMGHDPSNLLYTPVMYRNAAGHWVNDLHSQDCIIVDRLRMMRALQAVIHEAPSILFNQIRAVVHEVAGAVAD